MPDLHTDLHTMLQEAVRQALGPDHAQADPLLRPTSNPEFGDYQANLAMSLAKRVRAKPRDIAEQIAAALPQGEPFASVEVAGPGFINLTLTDNALQQHARQMLAHHKLGVDETDQPQHVVLDYSSPNVAKEMHVGHLRSTVIGDALARILSFRGDRITRQNHLGDWGTQFGMLIEHLIDTGFEPGQLQDQAESAIGNLNTLYQHAKQQFDADPGFADRARQRVVALQAGDETTLTFWRDLVEESKKHFNEVYHRLNVLLDDHDIRGESFYNDKLPSVVAELDENNLLSTSQGASVVFLEGFQDRDGQPLPFIVRKSDGGYLYATTDLAAARHRVQQLQAQRLIYVTDARQAQHFEMLFATLRQAGWADAHTQLDHVSFGTVLGPDRKPFKTRAGGTVRLADLLDEAEQRAERVVSGKNPDLSENERKLIAHVVGVGALKYADLASDRQKDYVFDWDRMLALEGNTAPYLQNAYVRIRSIFRKGQFDDDHVHSDMLSIGEPAERALVLKLLQLPQLIEAVAQSLEPHRLCTYLYELAALYHQFYEQCPVLIAPSTAIRDSRLALSMLVAQTLKQGLELLGIELVEQM